MIGKLLVYAVMQAKNTQGIFVSLSAFLFPINFIKHSCLLHMYLVMIGYYSQTTKQISVFNGNFIQEHCFEAAAVIGSGRRDHQTDFKCALTLT